MAITFFAVFELSERLSKWLSLFPLFLSYQNGYLNGYHFFRFFLSYHNAYLNGYHFFA